MEGGELFRHIQERGDQAFTERGTDQTQMHIQLNTSQILIFFFFFSPLSLHTMSRSLRNNEKHRGSC